jgi:hypothetical protein
MRKGSRLHGSRRAALLALAVALVAPATAAPAGHGSSHRYADGGRDCGDAPDIDTVEVANDDAGRITVQVSFLNRPEFRPLDHIVVALDTDRDATTGDRAGGEYRLVADRDEERMTFRLQAGSRRVLPLLGHGWSSNLIKFVVARADLAGATAFDLRLRSSSGQSGSGDEAPDTGLPAWGYEVRTRDTQPPRVDALPSVGTRGKYARLRYRVSDDSGTSREQVSVRRGASVVATIWSRLGPAESARVYFVVWRIPKAFGRQSLSFCLRSYDEAGNRSNRSCAPLDVR